MTLLETQCQKFREEGYVLIENALEPYGLDRVRAAYYVACHT